MMFLLQHSPQTASAALSSSSLFHLRGRLYQPLGRSVTFGDGGAKNPPAPSQSGGWETICWGDRCLITLVYLLPLQFSPTLSCTCIEADRTAREQTWSSPRCTGSGRATLHQTGQTEGTSQPRRGLSSEGRLGFQSEV